MKGGNCLWFNPFMTQGHTLIPDSWELLVLSQASAHHSRPRLPGAQVLELQGFDIAQGLAACQGTTSICSADWVLVWFHSLPSLCHLPLSWGLPEDPQWHTGCLLPKF